MSFNVCPHCGANLNATHSIIMEAQSKVLAHIEQGVGQLIEDFPAPPLGRIVRETRRCKRCGHDLRDFLKQDFGYLDPRNLEDAFEMVLDLAEEVILDMPYDDKPEVQRKRRLQTIALETVHRYLAVALGKAEVGGDVPPKEESSV